MNAQELKFVRLEHKLSFVSDKHIGILVTIFLT